MLMLTYIHTHYTQSAETAFSSLETLALNLLNLTGEFGTNSAWLSRSPRTLTTQLELLALEVGIAVDTAQKCEGQVRGRVLYMLYMLSSRMDYISIIIEKIN